MAKKKVLVVLGSPRKNGGSATLAKKIAEGARANGATVTTVFLQGMTLAGCKACEKCHREGATGCSIDDGMKAVYPMVIEADAYVFASPIYFFTMSAQMKTFIDRTYAVYDPDTATTPFRGKPFALAFAYGADDPMDAGCVNALRPFQDGLERYLGARLAGLVYGTTDACKKDEALLARAREVGAALVA